MVNMLFHMLPFRLQLLQLSHTEIKVQMSYVHKFPLYKVLSLQIPGLRCSTTHCHTCSLTVGATISQT